MEFFLPARFLSFSRAAVCTCVSRWPLRWLPTSGLGPAVAANASWAMPRSGPPCPSPFGGSLQCIAQAALRAALAIASRFFVLTATNNNTLSLKTNTTRQQKQPHRKHPAASASAFFHRHNAHPLALGLLNFQWNAPVSTQLHLLHEEGARRTSLDQFTALQECSKFRPLLNTNQILVLFTINWV